MLVGKRISREHFSESMKLILVAFVILLLVVPVYGWETAPGYEPVLTGNVSAKEYSVVAGDWRVTFDTNTSVFTNVVWKESRGLKNGGFYLIWLNASYQVAGIALLELEPGTFAPMTRTDLESYLQSFALTDLSKSKVLDRKIDGKDGLVAQRWDDKLGLMTYSACYPVDLTSDNTATTIVEFGSFIGEKPSQEIINSIHVKRLGAQAIGSSIGHVIPEIVPKGNRYSYDFETLGLDFSTPSGNLIMSDNKYQSFIRINLADDASMTGEIEELYSWEDGSSTAESAEKLWGGSNYDDHSPLITSRLDNGDYVVYGRYLSGQYMSTRALRTLDLNNDGQIDYYVVWDGSGKIDQDTITYIAEHSGVRTLKPKWD